MITSSNGNIFLCYWPFVRGIHRSPLNSPHKGQCRGALVFSLICAQIYSWVNNREAGDLRGHSLHYDVIVMRCEVHFIFIAGALLDCVVYPERTHTLHDLRHAKSSFNGIDNGICNICMNMHVHTNISYVIIYSHGLLCLNCSRFVVFLIVCV